MAVMFAKKRGEEPGTYNLKPQAEAERTLGKCYDRRDKTDSRPNSNMIQNRRNMTV